MPCRQVAVRRILLGLVGTLALLSCPVVPASASAGPCVPAGAATYRHSFDGGSGTARVTALRPLCSGERQTFSLLSYTTQSASFSYPQFIYDEAQATIDSGHPSARLAVTVPACYFQVDLIFGHDTYNEVINADSNYENIKLGAPYGTGSRSAGPYGGDADGTSPCVPKPLITYRNACDGTFTATLANDPSANIDAVFLVAGHRVHVAPGQVADAQRHTGTLSIRDNTFTTHIASWEKPVTGCDGSPQPTPAATSRPAGSAPPPAPGGGSAGPALPTSAPTAAAPVDTGEFPAPTTTPSGAVASPPSKTTDPSSFLVIALGVLLMVAGIAILVRVVRSFRRT